MKASSVIALGLVLLALVGCQNEQKFKSLNKPSGSQSVEPGVCIPTPNPQVEGNLYVEVGKPATFTYQVEKDPRWIIWFPEGEEVFIGETLTYTFNRPGQLRADAWGDNNCNQRVTQSFVIHVVPVLGEPSLVINNGSGSTRVPAVDLALTAENAQEMYITHDPSCTVDGSWEPYSPIKVWTLAAESADVRVYARFRTAARDSACVSDGILYDVTPPVINFVQVPTAQSHVPTAHFEFSVTDNTNPSQPLLCGVDSEPLQPCSLTRDLSGLVYGTHTMHIKAEDFGGNVSQDSYTWEYLNTPPLVRLLTAPPLVANTRDAEFTFEGEDDLGAVTFECALDQAAYAACTSPHRYSGLPNASYSFNVRAVDHLGLVSVPATYAWKVDVEDIPPPEPIPPVVTLTQTPATTTTDTVATFAFTATDSGVGIRGFYCSLDGSAPAVCTSPLNYKNIIVGAHTFSVYAVDNDELRSETVSYNWEVLKIRIPLIENFTIDTSGRKLDIIIVDDNSPSMTEEQERMAKRFSTFLSKLQDIDWQLGIVTTDAKEGKKPYQNGRLVPMVGLQSTYVINAKTPNVEKVFASTIVRKEWGTDDEEGIHSLYKMLLRPENRFIIRDQSHVATIIVSDEDERSNGKKLKTNNTPENLISTFQQLYGATNTFMNHSIILMPGYNQKACPQIGSNSYGATYAKLSKLTGGIVGDICAPDYGDILKTIGDAARRSTFTGILRCVPVGAVSVALTPQPANPVQHQVNGKELTLSPYPPMGTQVAVKYYCE